MTASPRNQSSTIAEILEKSAATIKWAIAVFREELVGIDGTGKVYGNMLMQATHVPHRVGQNKASSKFFIIDNCGLIYEVSVRELPETAGRHDDENED